MRDAAAFLQKHSQQIVEKALPARARAQHAFLLVEQSARARLSQAAGDVCERLAGACFEAGCPHAVGQTQSVHHEFERQFGGRDGACVLNESAVVGGFEVTHWVLVAHLAHDTLGSGEFAVGAGTNAKVIAESPIVEIVATARARAGEGRSFIMLETGFGQTGFDRLLHVGSGVIVGQGWGRAMERRVGFEREVVAGEVFGTKRQRGVEISERFSEALLRQGIHQVKVYAFEVVERDADCAARFHAVVNAAKGFEVRVVEALYADGQAVCTRLAEGAEACGFKGPGIGFKGDFGICRECGVARDCIDHSSETGWRHQTWRAAAKEHGVYRTPGKLWRTGVEILDDCVDVALLQARTVLAFA